MKIAIRQALPDDAPLVADFALRLQEEIAERTGAQEVESDPEALTLLCLKLLEEEHYTSLIATEEESGRTLGVANLCESFALYAGGNFGIIQEFYVLPAYRSQDVGAALLGAVADLARSRSWTRVELCTPPVPEFSRTLGFYERYGYTVTDGRKMQMRIE